jgi:hypothetical protein
MAFLLYIGSNRNPCTLRPSDSIIPAGIPARENHYFPTSDFDETVERDRAGPPVPLNQCRFQSITKNLPPVNLSFASSSDNKNEK